MTYALIGSGLCRDYMDRLLDETESAASSRAASPPANASNSSTSQSEREDSSGHNGERPSCADTDPSCGGRSQTLLAPQVRAEALQANGPPPPPPPLSTDSDSNSNGGGGASHERNGVEPLLEHREPAPPAPPAAAERPPKRCRTEAEVPGAGDLEAPLVQDN